MTSSRFGKSGRRDRRAADCENDGARSNSTTARNCNDKITVNLTPTSSAINQIRMDDSHNKRIYSRGGLSCGIVVR